MASDSELRRKLILEDYKEVLASEAGKRVFGGIFHLAGLNRVELKNEYAPGYHSLGLAVANTGSEADPLGVAKCEMAYTRFEENLKDNERNNTEAYTGTGTGE